MAWFWHKEAVESIDMKRMRDLEDRMERLENKFNSMKGYVYASKGKVDMSKFEQEQEEKGKDTKDLNSPLVPLPLDGMARQLYSGPERKIG